MTEQHPYSRVTREAMTLLASQIRLNRTEKGMTAGEVATRAGVSRGLVQRIEKGDLGCRIGAVLEVAHIVGVPLFSEDSTERKRHLKQTEDKLALLPARVRPPRRSIDDDF